MWHKLRSVGDIKAFITRPLPIGWSVRALIVLLSFESLFVQSIILLLFFCHLVNLAILVIYATFNLVSKLSFAFADLDIGKEKATINKNKTCVERANT